MVGRNRRGIFLGGETSALKWEVALPQEVINRTVVTVLSGLIV
jgi:hypothetical protein